MALGISKSYLGGVVSRHALITRVASSSSAAVCTRRALAFPTRGYAAAASAPLKKKGTARQKGTTTDPFAAIKGKPVPAEAAPEITIEEENAKKVEEIERMMAFQHLMPTVDPWGLTVPDTLDVAIPEPITLSAIKEPKKLLSTFRANFVNSLKNWSTFSLLVRHNAIPGFQVINLSWWEQAKLVMKSFGTRSTKAGALNAQLRQIALDSYKELNNALAQRNVKELSRITTAQYNDHVTSLAKANKKSNSRMIWTLHRTFEPVRIVSIRATEGYVAPNAPRTGHRLMIHALVKFDTEQSLEMYNARGAALHAPAPEPQDAEKSVEKWRVPAQRRRVTEYLVIEKLGWAPSPWRFREQVW